MKNKELIKYGIGIDIGKDKFHVCFKNAYSDGSTVIKGSRQYKNNISGYKDLKEWINKRLKDKEIGHQIVLEYTGVYHEMLVDYLYKEGFTVCLEQPKKVKKYLQSKGQYSKTDKLDSNGIAELACERKLKEWKPVSENILEIRTLCRFRKSLIMNKNRYGNQLHAISHSRAIGGDVKSSIKTLLSSLEEEIKKIEKEIMRLSKEDKSFYEKAKKISDSIFGLGMLSMLTILSETNGFEGFNSQKQLESYAGLDVLENSSGYHKGKTRISKRGNVHLRTALYMPSVTIVGGKSGKMYDLYDRLLKRNGGLKKKAMVAVQRKLLILTYRLWKKDEVFDPNYEEKRGVYLVKELV